MNAATTRLGTIGRYTIEITTAARPLSRYEQSKGIVAERAVFIAAGGPYCFQGVPSAILANPKQAAEAIFRNVSDRVLFAQLVADAVGA